MLSPLLFVCSGNTCRSVMAEALLKKKSPELKVASAGTASHPSFRIYGPLAEIFDSERISYKEHRARQVNQEIIDEAALVLCMEDGHTRYIKEHFPDAADKVFLLSEYAGEKGNIPDPIGSGKEIYRKTFDTISSLVDKILRERGGESNV